ncbi:MAG TPA: 2OG-Fe(II) oxygenase [Candidatus Limnocylindrales bacterium]|nr:2OG-Fe(II) oxygenase [Candidatus Limnocylindrales bacterium]
MLLDEESIALELGRTGIAVREQFLTADVVAELADNARAAHARGRFVAAAVGRGDARKVDAAVRGDLTLWLDPAAASAAERAYFDAVEELRSAVNQCLQLGAFEVEAHYALYPPGAAYARHRDVLRGTEARVVSTVLYLNEDWDGRDGGVLRVYLDGDSVREVLPRAGVFVCFLSDRFDHEVTVATRERWSVTAWLRRRR